MLIHRRRPKIERHLKLNLFIKNERIEMVRYHRILGVIFDKRAHICDAKARALKKINIIKSLSHTSWGSDQKTLLKINRMTILPTINQKRRTDQQQRRYTIKE
jgi:hypothetical protein